jgi:hypothetical protein
LQGTITSMIGTLTELVNLRIPGNNMGGTIPTHLGRLTQLEYLSVSTKKLQKNLTITISIQDVVGESILWKHSERNW